MRPAKSHGATILPSWIFLGFFQEISSHLEMSLLLPHGRIHHRGGGGRTLTRPIQLIQGHLCNLGLVLRLPRGHGAPRVVIRLYAPTTFRLSHNGEYTPDGLSLQVPQARVRSSFVVSTYLLGDGVPNLVLTPPYALITSRLPHNGEYAPVN